MTSENNKNIETTSTESVKKIRKKLIWTIVTIILVVAVSLYLFNVKQPQIIDYCLLFGLFIFRCFTTPVANKKNNLIKLIFNTYIFILAWSLKEKDYLTSIQLGMWIYFGAFAPLLDAYLYITRWFEKESQDNEQNEDVAGNFFGDLIKYGAQILLFGLFISVFVIMSTPEEFTPEAREKQVAIERQEALEKERIEQEQEREKALRPETTNGIQFSIVSKQLTNEATLMSMGIPSTGNSLVLAVIVNVKNNGQKPYKPNVRAQLRDDNGAIYAGNRYTNIVSILNSAQNILNPGMEKEELLFFKIPENKAFTLELHDGSFFAAPVSIRL